MTRADILLRLKVEIEGLYKGITGLDFVEVINFELRDDGALRIYVNVGYIGVPTIRHGHINDARDYTIDLTPREREFLTVTYTSQEPARVAPPTRVAQYTMHLVSQLRHVVGDGSELSCLTGALLSNPYLTDLTYSDTGVDSIVAYVERMLTNLACDHRSGAAVLWVTSLLSNPNLTSIVRYQQCLDNTARL